MSVRRLHSEQPESFEFSAENLEWARNVIGRYPEGRQASAVIPLLTRAQEQEGWVTQPAIEYVADMLSMPYIRVLEVATFYTQFLLQPVGKKAHIQVCGTTPCRLRGAGDLIRVCKNKIADKQFALSEDGDFSWEEVECAGACVNAPMIQISKDTYEDLTPEIFEELIDKIAAGKAVEPGSQTGRQGSAPATGPVTLTDPSLYDGSRVKWGLGAEMDEPEDEVETAEGAKKDAQSDATEGGQPDSSAESGMPVLLREPLDGKADNLKEISGIGPKIEQKLNGVGVFHFAQIAQWTDENIAFIDSQLAFRGRIARENWIEQAKVLASGAETDFSKRVQAGAVSSSKSGGDA
ncbi:NADH dehydrogenase subunit E [Cohaesibacter marisflavi]|uniref:NADH dehydrogenase subunit E n=1 Tax=Cohaesibacter marisflavi TaxID=655353 RepID=A0A1I5FP55_9HYPH|nr:NADH-quinone oxidoreductase subunit NuoE [Cohaesibacter marisflavi]SFO25532.1 NADH dehydrogenase subunit E [Cohaesibacter marisflavi]